MSRINYKILLVGGSGRGKTYSFRNMDRETTLFINVENKPLPFKGSFKHMVVPESPAEVRSALADGSKNPAINPEKYYPSMYGKGRVGDKPAGKTVVKKTTVIKKKK
jgi:hypothetical protein